MEEPSLQDSREDLFYTTTSEVFEYTPYEIEKRVSGSVFNRFFDNFYLAFKKFRSLLFRLVVMVSFTSLDFFKFTYSYTVYSKVKFLGFGALLESTKDGLVRGLMWRRGLLFRPATHGGVIAVVALAVVAGGLFTKNDIVAQDLTLAESAIPISNSTETIIPTDRPRSEIVSYKVVKGDTLSEVGEKFGVSVNSIRWASGLADTANIKPGDALKIPPVSGITHKVGKGQTIYSVAKKYKANPQAIADFPFNYLDQSFTLTSGQILIVPGGQKPKPAVLKTPTPSYQPPAPQFNYALGGSGLFAKPVAGSVNQYASWYHPGIDIGAAYGTPVYAAGSGRVITASPYGSGFGIHVFIDHGNGYITAYAHMSSMKVNVGQNVAKGQLIGAVGCSGFCTGSHLHFEVRRNGAKINPLSVF
ncbi:peptidoglycan DD-metalloendopeptidase family protein [Patescibacteria group bacterium]|nr:peptidoglycan DD-metalloendopeptidase family protein [Patescibacteria group bacterium]